MINRTLACLLLFGSAAALAGLGWRASRTRHPALAAVVNVRPERLLASGYDTGVVSITAASGAPRVTLLRSPHGTFLEAITGSYGRWETRIRPGVLPGRITVRVDVPGSGSKTVEMLSILDTRDRVADGTPDFLRLDQQRDRIAFRRWFTYLGEAQYFQPAATVPAEIVDCAALIRYAYREALRSHDTAWAEEAKLAVVPSLGSVEKFTYPYTPLKAALFRVRAGPFESRDLSDGSFLEFADAKTLLRFNTHVFSRDLSAAEPGDLLFFRQQTSPITYHSMIYLGPSQVRPDGCRYVLYHTGPAGANAGELRRLTVEELTRFPQPAWRPVATNPNFLGVARWNILQTGAGPSDVEQD